MSRAGPLRILHIHHGRAAGGAPLSLARLLAGLDRRRFESRVVVPGPGPAADLFRALDLPVTNLPVAVFYYLAQQPRVTLRTRAQHLLRGGPNRRALARLFAGWRPDLVHLNTALIPVSGAAARAAGIPVLWHVREVVPGADASAQRFLLEAARAQAATLVAISEAAAAPFRAIGPVRVIPEGVDVAAWWQPGARAALRAEFAAAPDDFVLLFPGMLLPAKGQGVLAEQLPELCRALPRLRVWFVAGEADLAYGRRLRERTAALTAAGRVRWLGWRDDLPGLMAAADAILTLPQGEEGFGLPLIEAMAAGRPVLSSALGPAREILPASEFPGCLVPAAGGAALAAALEGLAADPERRARLGEAGRARVAAHYTLAGMVEAFGPLFESAALTGPVVAP